MIDMYIDSFLKTLIPKVLQHVSDAVLANLKKVGNHCFSESFTVNLGGELDQNFSQVKFFSAHTYFKTLLSTLFSGM